MRRQRRELVAARIKLDRRQRKGRKQAAENRFPKVVAQERKRQAQVSAGKLRDLHIGRVEAAVGAARPQRVALLGPNGAGKTTLLRTIAGQLTPSTGTVTVGVEGMRYLPQRLDLLDNDRGVLDNVARFAPSATDNALRARLARFDLRGDRDELPAGTLSGGERFRALLAALLGAQPPPQLLMLDEPTNNLDMASVRQLEQALDVYRGALIVASHDLPFLRAVGITRWLHLDRERGLTDAALPHADAMALAPALQRSATTPAHDDHLRDGVRGGHLRAGAAAASRCR